jgi:hypothetical protein
VEIRQLIGDNKTNDFSKDS